MNTIPFFLVLNPGAAERETAGTGGGIASKKDQGRKGVGRALAAQELV